MPMQIEHIDAIARQKQRGVLFLEFRPLPAIDESGEPHSGNAATVWKTLPVRQQIIDWLDAQDMGWNPCGHFANLRLMKGYEGQIYIDVPYEPSLPAYRDLQAFLENPDGTVRDPQVTFVYCPLETAMENAAHDEPGFWAKWADDFE